MIFSEGDHVLEEAENVGVGLELLPIQPSDFVVLVVGIVVAKLRVQELVPGAEHRCTVGQQEQAAEILCQLAAQCADRRGSVFIPVPPTIPTVVFVGAVLIVIPVCPIALVVIGDEIVQREPVVGSYIIHALVGVTSVGAIVGKQIIASINPAYQVRDHPRIALNEAANVVAKPAVPLQPSLAWESASELISGCVPGLRDQTHPT